LVLVPSASACKCPDAWAHLLLSCRKLLDDVWRQFTKLSSPVTSSMTLDEEFSSSAYEVGEFDTPQASDTTVLVTGATGRCERFGCCPR
jgi:hypothetical protein